MNDGARWANRLALAAVFALLAALAAAMLWTTFMVYDDEGYVLYSAQRFVAGDALYDDVYTQYGPFFYLVVRATHALGMPLTNEGARLATLGAWMLTIAVAGRLVWTTTRGSLPATLLTMIGLFVHLNAMASEPSHPGGLIALMVMIAAWAGPRGSSRVHDGEISAPRLAVVAAIVSALVLVKINVGLLLAAGCVASLAALYRDDRLNGMKRHLSRAVAFVAIAVPTLVLLQRSFEQLWVQEFAAVVIAATAATCLATRPASSLRWSWRLVLISAATAAAVAGLTVLIVAMTGTSFAGLFDGVLLGPIRHPSVYSFPFHWRPGTLPVAAAGVILAAVLQRRPDAERISIIVALRLIVAAAYVACATGLFSIRTPAFALSFGVATAWVFVARTRDHDDSHALRAWLAFLLIAQSLHAYPVPGSQVSWGTFLLVPLLTLGIHDAAAHLQVRLARGLAAGALLLVAAGVLVDYTFVMRRRLRQSEPLQLAGAATLRMPESLATVLRVFVANVQAHGDVLFTLPGMLSFHTWTGVPPPTTVNTTHWFSLLSREQQDAIEARLRASPRTVLILQRYVHDLLERQQVLVQTPLMRYLQEDYELAFRIGSYEFWVQKGRVIAPLHAARLLTGAPGAPAKYQIDVTLAPPAEIEITRVELRQLDDDGSEPLQNWTAENAQLLQTRVDAVGHGVAPTQHLPFGGTVRGRTRLQIFTNALAANPGVDLLVLYAYDRSGRRVAEARFAE